MERLNHPKRKNPSLFFENKDGFKDSTPNILHHYPPKTSDGKRKMKWQSGQ
jgi:hypothetical protein